MYDLLRSPWNLINELADEKTQEEFDLDDILLEISLTLIKYRLKNNLTQKDLADKLEISQSMISKLESGDYNPSISQLWKISKRLGWTFNVTFNEETTETKIWNENDNILNYSNELNDELEIMDLLAAGA